MAVTIWPFILVVPWLDGMELVRVLTHEGVHGLQQRRWFVRGCGVGLLAWLALYLLALPVWWNPWRRKWETEAMLAEGRSLDEIARALRRRPYYLWRD